MTSTEPEEAKLACTNTEFFNGIDRKSPVGRLRMHARVGIEGRAHRFDSKGKVETAYLRVPH